MRKRISFSGLGIAAASAAIAVGIHCAPLAAQDRFHSDRPGQVGDWQAPINNDDVIRPSGTYDSSVESTDLTPVMADDGSGLPLELWQGMSVSTLEKLIAAIEIPPRSPALHRLWLRLITANLDAPAGANANRQFLALRLEILYRSGLIEEAQRLLETMPADDPVVAVLAARNAIAMGDEARACEGLRAAKVSGQLPGPVMVDAALISGLCAALAQDAAGAGLAAELARDAGASGSPGLMALDALAMGGKPGAAAAAGDATAGLIDYRLIKLAGGEIDEKALIKRASPALLASLARDRTVPLGARLAAGETALKLNAITVEQLGELYRQLSPSDAVISDAQGTDTPERRAALFLVAERENTPQKKVRLIRAFLDEARHADFYLAALRMVSPLSDTLYPAPEIGWYSETGVEVALAAGNFGKARQWAAFGSDANASVSGGRLDHWSALIDIAEGARPATEQDMRPLEDLAVQGRLDAALLHRLATVLDALDYPVPLPLWERASSTSQPAGGHLPETGVLTELQDAAKKREFGRTVLLTMKTLGPNGAEGAHMIALGDSIRALQRTGLAPDAHSLGFEALFTTWPRAVSN
ncbi:hypothetical protein APY04_2413 [Hyphomicrobium sulfonivorans]|uniref:Antifreeze glycopeptide AFGP polyprotein n=1 Tax=Hyphomicrobium sulfonivorans TaxID=121290 RepID=A0A109BCQ2_HYPSL|nr:hypothetical protein [Hyphomicrobium sulfonivorans]KWT66217.1 hypothetical protein APY04_2413 [Hyphomicrobium sulfonivorans]